MPCEPMKRARGCGPLTFGQCRSLKDMVDLFLNERDGRPERELQWWGDSAISFERACRRAMFTLESEIRRDGHQWIFSTADLNAMGRELARHEARLSQAATFDALYRAVEQVLGISKGGKPLLIYDVTRRLGYRLNLHPARVYLHRGPKAGANALRLGFGRPRSRPLEEFPASIRSRLTAAQTEDFLCLARDHLRPELWD